MLLTIIALLSVTYASTASVTSLHGVTNNTGYVSYKRSFADIGCYRPSHVRVSFDNDIVVFEEHENGFDVVAKELNLVMVDHTVHYLLRSNLLMRFVRLARDDEFSSAFAYMKSIRGEVECEFDEKGKGILTDIGRAKWNGGMNKEFLKECGDLVVRKYDVGIALVYVYKLSFQSKHMKEMFMKRYVSDNDKIGTFDAFVERLQLKLKKYNIYASSNSSGNSNTVKLKLYAFQLGGDAHPLINSAMNDNDNPFLISTYIYTSNNTFISYDNSHINELAYYFNHSFPQQLKSQTNYVPVERFSVQQVQDYLSETNINLQLLTYNEMINNSHIQQRRLLNLVDHLDFVYEKIKHIYDYFPVRTNEIETMHNQLKAYYDYVTIAGNGIDCFMKDNGTECVKDLIFSYKELNYREYIVSLYDFIKDFHNEITYSINIHNDMCLPKGMSWSAHMVFELHKYKTIYYMTCSDSTFHCHYKGNSVFQCSDGIISIDFSYDDNGSSMYYIQCTNEYYATQFKQSIAATKRTNNNEFGFNIPPIDF